MEDFTALKEAHALEDMALDALVELNTKVSALRRAAGGELRKQIHDYALEVNRWVTQRAGEREAAIAAAQAADPERARLRQGVSLGGVASDGKFDALVEAAARRQR